MLKYGNQEFRNLQEQVEKNMIDIQDIRQGDVVLNQFGIKVVEEVESFDDIPSVANYKESHEDWAYGDAYAVGTESPYELYILTRANEEHDSDYWFDIGAFPQPGPQGEQGEQGEVGATPVITGAATVTTLSAGQSATVSVTKSGTDAAPTLTFAFGIPQGEAGVAGEMGATGPQGPQGPTGPQGPKGDTGNFNLVGVLASESLLPDPDEVPFNTAYLVGASTPYDVYIILNDPEGKSWIDAGPIVDVDIDNFVQLDEDNTFTGDNTFTKTVTIGGNGSTTEGLEIKSLSGAYKTRLETVNGNLIIKNSAGTPMATIQASGGITVSKINPNNNNYGLVSPDTTSWAVSKTIATTDQIPSVNYPVTDVQVGGVSVVSGTVASITLPSVPVQDVTVDGVSVVSSGTAAISLSGKLDASMCTYQTTAPTAAIADGGVHIVYLASEPAIQYSGYIYMIAEA